MTVRTVVTIVLGSVLVLAPALVEAQSPQPATTPASAPAQAAVPVEESSFDRIWKTFTTWYDNPSNPMLQRVLFAGRFQQDFAAVNAEQGDHDEWNTRRFRVGHRLIFFRDFTLHGEAELNPQEAEPFYVRLTDMYGQWSNNARLVVTVGKHSIPFTMDGSTSSKDLIAIDRSNLTNNIWFSQEYLPGASVSGKISHWTYRGGLYSAGATNREFGEFSGGAVALTSVGFDFGNRLGVSQATLTGNYVHQNPDTDNTFTRQLEHILSVNFRVETADWGLRTDVSTGDGYFEQRDLWGVMAMPYYKISNKLQAVGRYTVVKSDGVNGVRLATYENTVVPRGQGDRYQELYLGANYYIYDHKLKLQTGLQFGDMNDRANDGGAYSGVSWTSGLRIGW